MNIWAVGTCFVLTLVGWLACYWSYRGGWREGYRAGYDGALFEVMQRLVQLSQQQAAEIIEGCNTILRSEAARALIEDAYGEGE